MNSLSIITLLLIGTIGSQAASVAEPVCGGISSSKNVQLLTPNYPPLECVYHIKPHSNRVCQLRIDFAMTLAQPVLNTVSSGVTYAECTTDSFEVNGLRLCGVETDQHIYVPVNGSAVDIVFRVAPRSGGSRLPMPSWDVRIRQLECSSGLHTAAEEALATPEESAAVKDAFLLAPTGCLQYFPYASGRVTSFNLNNGRGIYPSNLNYAICFRRDISAKALEIVSHYFHVGSEGYEETNLQTDQNCYHDRKRIHGNSDYLMIPQALLVSQNTLATYFCGNTNTPVAIRSLNPGPLIVLFNSERVYKQTHEGFSFTYSVV